MTTPTEAYERIEALLKICAKHNHGFQATPCEVTEAAKQALAHLEALKPPAQQPEQVGGLPFWDILCHDCGWKGDSETVADECPKCGATGAQLWERMDIPERPMNSQPTAQQPAQGAEVERVARAIAAQRKAAGKLTRTELCGVAQDSEWLHYQQEAMAAIAALSHPLTPADREEMVRVMAGEIEAHPIYLKSDKQLRAMLKDRHRPVSVYHNDETAREVAEAALSALEAKGMLKGGEA